MWKLDDELVVSISTHLKKLLVNLDHLPKARGEHNKMYETTTQNETGI